MMVMVNMSQRGEVAECALTLLRSGGSAYQVVVDFVLQFAPVRPNRSFPLLGLSQ